MAMGQEKKRKTYSDGTFPDTAKDYDMTTCYIYVTGGRVRGRTLGSVERFSFEKSEWQLCPPLLENRGSHGACAVGDKIFVLGGGGFRSNLATCEVFLTQENRWAPIEAMKTFRHALVIVPLSSSLKSKKVPKVFDVVDGADVGPTESCDDEIDRISNSIYAIGGWVDGKYCSADIERYDVETNSWHTCAPMSIPRRLLGAAAFGGKIFVFGGNCDDGVWYTAAVECYDPSTDTWTAKQPLPFPGPASAVSVGRYIFVFLHGKQVVRYCPSSDEYELLSVLPLPEWFTFDVTSMGPKVYLHGGATKGTWSKAMFSYDTRDDSWTAMPDMLRQRRRCAAAMVDVSVSVC